VAGSPRALLVLAGLANPADVRERTETKQAQTVALLVGIPSENTVLHVQVVTYG